MSRQPVLLLGHGSPMNAIEENIYVEGFRAIAAQLSRPKAILCISAHWESFAWTGSLVFGDFTGSRTESECWPVD